MFYYLTVKPLLTDSFWLLYSLDLMDRRDGRVRPLSPDFLVLRLASDVGDQRWSHLPHLR